MLFGYWCGVWVHLKRIDGARRAEPWTALRQASTPGAVPRGCYTCYRGNLAVGSRPVEQENTSFATARIGVNMAAPDVLAKERDKLTAWVNVIRSCER